MAYYLTKLIISAVLIVLVSEVSKRYSVAGGLLASLPLVSYLGMIWLWVDTKNPQKVVDLSWSIFWLVLPSLALFVALPLLMKRWSFVPSLAASTVIMFGCYGVMVAVLRKFGVST